MQTQLPLAAILNAVTDGITVQDKTGALVYANETAAALTGYASPQALLAVPAGEVMTQFDIIDGLGLPFPSDRLPGSLLLKGLESAPVTLRFRVKATGLERWAVVHARVIHDIQGDLEFVVSTFHDLSEHKRVEETLKVSEENYRQLVENANDVIYTLDLEGKLTSLNRAGEVILGYSAEELLHKPVIDLAAPEDIALGQAMLSHKLTTGERTRYELSLRTKAGQTVTLDMNSRLVLRDGKPIGMQGIGRDITERKRVDIRQRFLAEASARLTESLDYEITLANVAQLMTPTIADWSAIDVVTETGIIQRVAVSHVKPDMVTWAYELQRRYPVDINAPRGVAYVLRTGQPEFYPLLSEEMLTASARDADQIEIIRKVGFRSAIVVPLTVQGRTLGAMTLVSTTESGRLFDQTDVTLAEELGRMAGLAIQNARSYREAQLERERLQVTLASIGDAVIATDVDGKITFMNGISEALTGWPQEEAIGKPLTQVFHIINEQSRQIAEDPVQKVFEHGVIVGLANHTLLIARDGRETPIEDSAAPIRDFQKNLVGAVLVYRDVTEERKGEIVLRQAQTAAEAARLNLHNLFMEAPALIGILRGPGGHVELFNPLFTRLWGGRDVMGKSMREAFPELEGQGWFEIREQVYATGESITGTEREAIFDRNNDGKLEQSFFNFVYQATHDANGVIDGVAIYGVEVTDLVIARKQAEEIAKELRGTQERLQLLIDSAQDYAIFGLDMQGHITSWNVGAARVFGYTESEAIGQKSEILFTTEDRTHGIPAQEIKKAADIGYAEDERWHLRKDGTLFYTSGTVRPIRNEVGVLQGFIKVARDRTQHQLIMQRTQLLQHLASDLSSHLMMHDMAETIIQHSLEAVGGKIGDLFLYIAEDNALHRLATEGVSPAFYNSHQRFSLEMPLPMTDAVRLRELIWLANQQDYTARYPHVYQGLLELNIHAALYLPLMLDSQVLGVLGISFDHAKVLTPEEQDVLIAVAHLCAQAMERARLYEQAQTAAALRERQRLARDLHDAVNQTLFSATIMAESLPRLWKRDPERVFPLLQQVHTLNRAAASEMRVLLWELRPEAMEKTPLQELYTQLANAIQGRKLVHVSLDLQLNFPLALTTAVHMAFYRIAQEAINNAVKHAQAKVITLKLASSMTHVELCVIDDGVGFAEMPDSGIGMTSMRERAEEIDARLTVASAVNKGTQVTLLWERL